MFALACLFMTVVFIVLAVSSYEDGFLFGFFVGVLLSLTSFVLFLSQIQS